MKKNLLLILAALLVGCQALPPDSLPRFPILPSPTSTGAREVTPQATRGPLPVTDVPTPAGPTPTSSTTKIRSLAGDLLYQVSILESRMPRPKSSGYVQPGDGEMAAFKELVAALERGDVSSAVDLAAANHYELLQFADQGDGNRESYLLRELSPIQYGWGLYAFRLGSDNPLIIQAPHPLADEMTPQIAAQLYRVLGGRALMIAGAHRDADRQGIADVAHNADSIFQAIHLSLLEPGSVVLQIHGFASTRHPGYPQVVLGYDHDPSNELVQRLADALVARGVRVGICQGESWEALCGETNVQSSSMTEGAFIHIELDETIRTNVQPLLAALEQVFGR